jgi:hypothetical protein
MPKALLRKSFNLIRIKYAERILASPTSGNPLVQRWFERTELMTMSFHRMPAGLDDGFVKRGELTLNPGQTNPSTKSGAGYFGDFNS